jgi:hypothetical protein
VSFHDDRAEACVLVGNGLSIAVNPDLRLDRLTEQFLDRHEADRGDLESLIARIDMEGVEPAVDFEGVVAALEAAAEIVGAFAGLASRSANADLRDAAAILEERGITGLVRRLYFAYCAEILDSIGEGARVALPMEVVAFGEWLKRLQASHDRMGIFTLNYDVLLERMLVNEDQLGLSAATTDFFSGLPDRSERVALVPGLPEITGRLFYPEDPPPGRPIHLHHLHGCLTHFRRRSDGSVFKFSAGDVRDSFVYQQLAVAEDSNYEPAIILGSRKVSKSREWPFVFGFLQFEQSARRARTIVIAGYSFRDAAVNDRLAAAAQGAERRWIVINRKEGEAAREYISTVQATLAPASPEFVMSGFDPDGVPAV